MTEVATTYNGKSVKDVPAEEFIKAFSSYLKSTGKVSKLDRAYKPKNTSVAIHVAPQWRFGCLI